MPVSPHRPESPRPADASAALPESARERIADLFAGSVRDHRTAGLTWGVIGGHAHAQELLAAGAVGAQELRGGAPAPGSSPMDTTTISRIASMTKSFTAAVVLRLRDAGRLRLDDPVAELLPEAAALTPAAPDAPVITVRHLLTMSAGLITDNPWGDRQESMTREDFAALLAGGLGHVHVPGTGFEYSNTGYALLGRIIDEVDGRPYDRAITEELLRPLGMTDTAFAVDQVDASRVATGHRIADREDATRFEPVPMDTPGVYGAMAGLFSTTADVARWVRFLAAADAPDAATRPQDLLSTSSRREMQQLHRIQHTSPLPVGEDGLSPGFDRVRGYGFGLVVERFPDMGEVISHSGGYPGYGSFMCWHRPTGVGVVALANAKYAPASMLSMQALRVLREQTDLLVPPAPAAAPRTREVAAGALAWLASAQGPSDAQADQLADAWFADNMDLDVPRAERIRRRDAALSGAGLETADLARLRPEDAEVISRAHLRWTLPSRVDNGRDVQIDLLVDPRAASLAQALDVAPAP